MSRGYIVGTSTVTIRGMEAAGMGGRKLGRRKASQRPTQLLLRKTVEIHVEMDLRWARSTPFRVRSAFVPALLREESPSGYCVCTRYL
jgi:hypothetical protein